jgi:hypothetical protein
MSKEDGMALALSPEEINEWKRRFRRAVTLLAAEGNTFTSEDVIELVGLPRENVKKDRNNAVGAMMNGMAKRGVIRKTGRHVLSKRPTSNGAELNEWTGA